MAKLDWAKLIRRQGWILAVATIFGLIYGGYTFIKHASDASVYVINCGEQQYRSSQITGACGDNGVGVTKIHWESWNKRYAEGKALFYINDCKPDCAQGKLIETEVKVSLSKLKIIQGKPTYTQIKITNREKKPLPGNKARVVYWNLNEI